MAFGFAPTGGMFGDLLHTRGPGATKTRTYGVQGGLPMYDNTTDEGQMSAGAQEGLAKRGQDLNFQQAQLPWNFKQGVFDKTFPLLQGLISGGGGGGLNFGRVGGENTPLPQLPNSFVYSPQQIQQQVNAAHSTADTGAATQKQQIGEQMAGRGFSGRSPIAMALQQAADVTGRAQGADQERQIRFGAAGQNAQQALGVGQLAQTAWQGFNQADIARRQAAVDAALGGQRNMAALIGALGSFGG